MALVIYPEYQSATKIYNNSCKMLQIIQIKFDDIFFYNNNNSFLAYKGDIGCVIVINKIYESLLVDLKKIEHSF